MRILFIHQQGTAQASGAAIAMHQLHRGLLERGHESTVASVTGDFSQPDLVQLPTPGRREKWLGKVTWRLGFNDLHCLESFKIPTLRVFREADVVNIHGFHSGFFNYMALPTLATRKPLIATFHDMWNLTGHCSYAYDCDRWTTGCGSCPRLDVHPPVARDATAWEWKLKNSAYRRSPMEVVATSQWLCDQVKRSMLKDHPLHKIRYGVDVEAYRPRPQAEARQALDLDPDAHVILFAAASVKNHIKGVDLLINALQTLPEDVRNRAVLLTFGDRGDLRSSCRIPSVSLGYVSSDRIKALAYAAADLFVLPSREEVQGIVLLESMACGTPVVAFDVGGVPEVVEHETTGLLAAPESVEGLRDGIVRMLTDEPLRRELGENGRRLMCRELTMDHHVDRYLEVFEGVVGGERRKVA